VSQEGGVNFPQTFASNASNFSSNTNTNN
jgi:hypothetical protein